MTVEDFCTGGNVYQIGLPPQRIDVVTSVSGVDFATAWENRMSFPFLGHPVEVMSRSDFIRNKKASGRPKDLADIVAVQQMNDAEERELQE